MTKVKTKRTIKLNELTEADAQFISIVGRGANNTPFKIIKQETEGMDLGKLFKKEDTSAFVKALVVNKSSDLVAAKARIEKAGFSIENEQEIGDVIVFSQSDEEGPSANQVIIKYDEDIALVAVCKSFQSWDFETSSFNELFEKQGVWPTLSTAHSTLWEVLCNIMCHEDSKDPGEVAGKMGTAIKEYRMFVMDMVKNLPVTAFKLEDPSLTGDVQTTEKEEKQMSEQEIAKKENEQVADQKTQGAATQQEQLELPLGEVSQKADAKEGSEKESEMSALLKAVQGLTADIKDLRASVEKTGEEQATLKDRVEEIATVAKSADEALNGLTNAGAQGDRSVEKKEAQKASAPLTSSAHKMSKTYYG